MTTNQSKRTLHHLDAIGIGMSSTIDQNETTSLSDGGGDANVTAATFTSSNKDDAPTPVDATKITTTTQEQQCRRQPQRRRLGIDDIVRATPLEEEAETFIVEAIENRERLGGGNPDNDVKLKFYQILL